MTSLDIVINREDEGWPAGLETRLRETAETVLTRALVSGADAVEIGITLADDETVRALNRDHRGKDKPTNVLSFPLADGDFEAEAPGAPLLLGDVILARETVAREAAEQGKSLENHAAHLVAHGVLHLLGYDHETEAEAEAMERLEIEALRGLGVPDPYTDPSPKRP